MKFSIITLTFNSEKTIRDTLNSVMSQNYQNFEHIIIDGGSKDSTIKILNKYKSRNVKFYIKKISTYTNLLILRLINQKENIF